MNDAMCKARFNFLGNQFSKGCLFDTTPEVEIPDPEKLGNDLIRMLNLAGVMTRKALRIRLIWETYFGRVETKGVNKVIAELLKSNRIFSETGKSRINDTVKLSCDPTLLKS
jgi:hypothetical protein